MTKSDTQPDAGICVRPFERRDALELIGLMKALATFEGYIDAFDVTADDLIQHGLCTVPRFGVFVAEQRDRRGLLGMAVHYVIPWTYDMKPTLVLKELFVGEEARGQGVGRKLMTAVAKEAARISASRIIWTVLADNEPAKRFYASLGGEADSKWHPWVLRQDAIAALSGKEVSK